jgi:hypothetical protein
MDKHIHEEFERVAHLADANAQISAVGAVDDEVVTRDSAEAGITVNADAETQSDKESQTGDSAEAGTTRTTVSNDAEALTTVDDTAKARTTIDEAQTTVSNDAEAQTTVFNAAELELLFMKLKLLHSPKLLKIKYQVHQPSSIMRRWRM